MSCATVCRRTGRPTSSSKSPAEHLQRAKAVVQKERFLQREHAACALAPLLPAHNVSAQSACIQALKRLAICTDHCLLKARAQLRLQPMMLECGPCLQETRNEGAAAGVNNIKHARSGHVLSVQLQLRGLWLCVTKTSMAGERDARLHSCSAHSDVYTCSNTHREESCPVRHVSYSITWGQQSSLIGSTDPHLHVDCKPCALALLACTCCHAAGRMWPSFASTASSP